MRNLCLIASALFPVRSLVPRALMILLLLPFLIGQAAVADEIDNPVEAYFDAEGAVVINWFLSEWDEGLAGFGLTRALAGIAEDGDEREWSVVGEALIRPDLDMARLQRLELDEVIEQRPQLNQEHIASSDLMIAGFMESAEEFQKLHFLARVGPQWAVAFGLGWIDREVEFGETYIYRVHRMVRGADGLVERGALVGEVEVTVARSAIAMPPLETWSVDRRAAPQTVELTWSIRADALVEHGDIRGFSILFGDPDAPLENVLAWVHRGRGVVSEDGQLVSFSVGRRIETDEAVKFALQPTGLRDETGSLSPRIVLAELGGDMGVVRNLEVSFEDGSAVLDWDYDAPDVGAFDGFRVARWGRVDGESVVTVLTEELLPSGRRSYIDAGVLDELGGEDVTYSVQAVSGDSRLEAPSGSARVTIPAAQPAVPSALRVVPAIRDGVAYVDIAVDYESDIPADRFVVYRLTSESRLWVRFASMNSDDPTARVELRESFPGSTAFRAVAFRRDAPNSDPSQEAHVRLPARSVPAQASRMRVSEFADRVEFRWWARSSEFVAGARILVDGEVVADETVLGPDVRRWTWRVPPDAVGRDYSIVLVDEFGRVSESRAGLLATAPLVPDDTPAVENDDNALPEIVGATTRRSYYDDAEDKIWIETEYAIGEDGEEFKHGTTTNYDREGRIVRQVTTVYGVSHGPSRLFNPDGSIRRIVFKLNGEVVTLEQMNEELGEDWMTPEDQRWFANQE